MKSPNAIVAMACTPPRHKIASAPAACIAWTVAGWIPRGAPPPGSARGLQRLAVGGRDRQGVRLEQQVLDVLILHTIGAAAFAASPRPTAGRSSVRSAAERSGTFEHGLDWILAGVARQR